MSELDIAAIRRDALAASLNAECQRADALERRLTQAREALERARAIIEHITHHAGNCFSCGAAEGHTEICLAINSCPRCIARAALDATQEEAK